MKKQAENWLNAAKDDLILVNEVIHNEHLSHIVAFHSQQVIEKSIKAILEEKEAKVPRIHNIITLKEKIEGYIKLNIDQEIFDQLNELYIDARYPTDLGLLPTGKPSKEIATKFLNTATEIYESITEYLSN